MLPGKCSPEKKLTGTGNILHQMCDTFTLVCKDLTRQVGSTHVWTMAIGIKKNFLDHIRFTEEDFAENQRHRIHGHEEVAKIY